MATSTSSNPVHQPPQHKVFLNFRGADVRLNFVSHLEDALKRVGINYFIDKKLKGERLEKLFKMIEESSIAIVVISSTYADSKWCLDELAKIQECAEKEKMRVFPVFYQVTVASVTDQKGIFWNYLRGTILKHNPDSGRKEAWENALNFVPKNGGQVVDEKSCEGTAIKEIVEAVMRMLDDISKERAEGRGGTQKKMLREKGAEDRTCSLYGLETRAKQLEDKLKIQSKVTRIVGVVGMPGIGKTTLAKKVLENQRCNFIYAMYLGGISRKSKDSPKKLHDHFFLQLYNNKSNGNRDPFSLEGVKASLRKKKTFVVLDDVSDKTHLNAILENREWICEGSKIVIITRSESAVKGIVNDTYFVSGLSHIDALKLFNNHAFSRVECCSDPSLRKLAGEFVDYTGGHPLALKVLGGELHNTTEKTFWESKRGTLTKCLSNTIQDGLKVTYDELGELDELDEPRRQNVFLDIACFFRFGDEYHVKSLLDSSSSHDDIKLLADKFLINICAGRLEMNDLIYTFAMGLVSQASPENRSRLFNHGDIVGVLKAKSEAKVRGIFLDVSKVTTNVMLDSDTFASMCNLRYLKLYNSRCPKLCESECTVNFPDGVEFTLQEIRYLHWLKFPSEKFPQEFDPRNLVDLKLPYSKMEQIWDGEKDASKLKWLDMNNSRKLRTLTGLSQARNLQTLNLEGCTELKVVHEEVQNMDSLAFLNLRGCTSLESLPEMNLVALKILILSGCSKFEEFHMVGKNLKELYLDGTVIKGLPSTIGDLQSLVLLKLNDCVHRSSLPDTVGNLKALEKLILSGCLKLETLPKFQTTLKTLLFDRTSIYFPLQQLPCGSFLLSSVRHLCLSRNSFKSLPSEISFLYNLRWLNLKYCKELGYVPVLPPNLEWLDAHGCISLEKVADPSPLWLGETKRTHSTFNFSNCNKLDQVAQNSIETYVRRKIQLMSTAVARNDEVSFLDVSIRVCYPGSQLPVWFDHRTVGSELNEELPRHWSDGGITGIALCAVVSFTNDLTQNSRLSVRCTGEFTEKNRSRIRFNCILRGCSERDSDKPMEIVSSHVFIGYMSWSHINKCNGETDDTSDCVATEASVKVEVIDGTRQVTNCEVLKCGFSLIYASTEVDHGLSPGESSGEYTGSDTLSEESYDVASPRKDSKIREEGGSDTDYDAASSAVKLLYLQ